MRLNSPKKDTEDTPSKKLKPNIEKQVTNESTVEKPAELESKPVKKIFGFGFTGPTFSSLKASENKLFANSNQSLTEMTGEIKAIQAEDKVNLNNNIVETGEEDEDVVLQMRAKLFDLVKKDDKVDWVEKGKGLLKLLIHHEKKARLVMRTEGSLKLILNIYLFADIPCELLQDKFVRISCFPEIGNLKTYLIQLKNAEIAEKLYSKILQHSKADEDQDNGVLERFIFDEEETRSHNLNDEAIQAISSEEDDDKDVEEPVSKRKKLIDNEDEHSSKLSNHEHDSQ